MFYLKAIYPEVVLIEIKEVQHALRALNESHGLFFSSALQIISILDHFPNIIVYESTINRNNLYGSKDSALKASGFAVPDTIINLKKLGNNFMLLDDVMIAPNKIYFNLHYLSDSWVNTQHLPILRTHLINQFLKEN